VARALESAGICRGYSELLTVWAGIMLWQWSAKTHVSGEMRWSLYGGAFLAISFWNCHQAVGRAEAAETAAKKLQSPAPLRKFAEEPEAMIAHLGDPKLLTAMLVVGYHDKWIAIAGTVEFAGGTHVTLILVRGQRVNLRFSDTEESKLRDFRRGQYLSAICRIRPSYSHSGVALENAELVRLDPYRTVLARVS
jgi:hypothetical protein